MTTQFRLTKEESALMNECRRTSFWYRSVPLMAATSALLTYRRMTNQMGPQFYGLKLAAGMFGAYALGKISYVPECRRLILERLPDSNLARSFDSKPYELISDIAQPPEIVSKSATTNIFGGHSNEVEDPPESIVPSNDNTDKSATPRYVTYDELRQKNRAEHAMKFSGPKARNESPTNNAAKNVPVQDTNKSIPSPPILDDGQSLKQIQKNPAKRSTARTNQYGDEIYD